MKREIFIEATSMLYVILFIYTGISKLIDYTLFKEQIAESPILTPVAPFVAFALPWTEFIVAIMLLIPRWRLKGLYASLLLMISFTCYIIIILTFNEHIPCSCGGVMEELSWTDHIVFNSVFTLLSLIAIIFKIRTNIEVKKAAAISTQ